MNIPSQTFLAYNPDFVVPYGLSVPKIAITSVFKSQSQNRNSRCRFRRKIAEKSRNEIANRCVFEIANSKSQHFPFFECFSANDVDPVVHLQVRAQTISVGQFHIQSYESSGNNGACCWRKLIDDAISAYLSLAEEKNQFQMPKCQSKNHSVLFCPRFKIAAFSRFQNIAAFSGR